MQNPSGLRELTIRGVILGGVITLLFHLAWRHLDDGSAVTLTALAAELPKLTLTVEAAPTRTTPGRLSLAAP